MRATSARVTSLTLQSPTASFLKTLTNVAVTNSAALNSSRNIAAIHLNSCSTQASSVSDATSLRRSTHSLPVLRIAAGSNVNRNYHQSRASFSSNAVASQPTAPAHSIDFTCNRHSFDSSTATKRQTKPSDYFDAHKLSIEQPEQFWSRAAEEILWYDASGPVLSHPDPIAKPWQSRWFASRSTNMCLNCIDVHLHQGRGDQLALIYDSPVQQPHVIERITYRQLYERVNALACAMHKSGMQSGDCVLIYMPQVPESIVAIMACARLGLIQSTVFGGFAAPELAKRIADCQPRMIVSASCGLEGSKVIPYKPILDEAITLSKHAPDRVVIVERPQCAASLLPNRDVAYADFVREGGEIECVALPSTHPLQIMYTSGTTGTPKGVVRDTGGYAVSLRWTMKHLLDLHAGETWFCTSDIGWIVGQSLIIYGPLLAGATTIIFEGKPVSTPDAGAFWRTIKLHQAVGLYTSPTALRAIKKEDPQGVFVQKEGVKQSSLRALYLAGERGDPDTIQWAQKLLNKPIIDNMWQTESGRPVTCNPIGQHLFPVKPGSSTYGSAGHDMKVLDDEGNVITKPNVEGNLALKLPLPPAHLLTLWKNEERFKKSYFERFPGYYDVADGGFIDADGYIHVLGRTDDIINCAGHRLSSGQLESALTRHPSIAEAAVVGAKDALKGHVPIGFVVLKSNLQVNAIDPLALEKELVAAVRAEVGAVASFKIALIAERLPKTRSGKILRNVIRNIVNGEQDLKIPATVEDLTAVTELQQTVQAARAAHRL